jgi:AraC-like DNA-binding protein
MPAPPLTFLYGESVPRCTHRIDKHFEGYSTLQFMSGGGSVELAVDEREWRLEGRWFWSAYPGPRVRFHVAPGSKAWQHRYIAFRGTLVGRWMDEGLFPIDPQLAPPGRNFGEAFDGLLTHALSGERWNQRRAVHLLEGMLIDLAEDRANVERRPAWLKTVMNRLRDLAARSAGNDTAPLDYDALAAEVDMAGSTLRRRFREATGLAPHQFVLQHRVAEARQMLGETDVPIKSIARQLGYRDVYFFSRQFRQLAGVPPALYRKSRQG